MDYACTRFYRMSFSLKGTTIVEGNEYVQYKTPNDVLRNVFDIVVTFTEETINALVDVDVIGCYEISK